MATDLQLDFWANFLGVQNEPWTGSNGTLSFIPMLLPASISIVTLNILFAKNASGGSHSWSVGLYSLTGSTLSIANSWSQSFAATSIAHRSLVATSATQNITPGNWWLGILVSTAVSSGFTLYGSVINPGNAFPGGFYMGRMTDSTNALPGSYATSNLDITGGDAMGIPFIILTA